jgi:hypothetical protein
MTLASHTLVAIAILKKLIGLRICMENNDGWHIKLIIHDQGVLFSTSSYPREGNFQ